MRFRLIPIILILSILLLSACRATPEKEIVVNKGNGELEGIIQSAPVASEQAMDGSTWVESYTIPKLECEINAKVITPEKKIFPVYKVKKRTFDASFTGTIIKLFTAGATGVRKTSPTKEELTQQLVQVKRGTYVFDDNGGRWEPYEGQEQEIAQLEEQIKNAPPEVFDPITNDTSTLPADKTYAMEGEQHSCSPRIVQFGRIT